MARPMKSSDVEDKLQEIVRAALELKPGTDVTHAQQANIASWDSLAHVSLMLALEGEFGVTIGMRDQLELTSYDAIRRYFADHRGNGASS
jgi:acyl carrier protein